MLGGYLMHTLMVAAALMTIALTIDLWPQIGLLQARGGFLPWEIARLAALRLPDLLQATDVAADHVLSGRYDHVLPVGGPPTTDRWFTRLHGDDELDVWLISWVPDKSTELHDHGGSLGALTVLTTMFFWWRDVVREARTPGGHSPIVQLSLRYGMTLFIGSEVMFFVGFFWSYFNFLLFPETQGNGQTVWPPSTILRLSLL